MPTFEPKKWHACQPDDWKCTNGVNCYSYILDNPKYFWAVPGIGFAHTETRKYFDSFNTLFQDTPIPEFQNKIKEGAKKDGLIPVETQKDQAGFTLAALFFPKNEHDFHWYRKDSDGTWSHKNGYQAVRNTDESGEIITDPKKADRGEYEAFGGYFLVPSTGVKLSETFPI